MSGLFGGSKTPAAPAPLPPVPTIDEAARERDVNDAMRKRKGRLAAIYAGKTASASSGAATKTLTGE